MKLTRKIETTLSADYSDDRLLIYRLESAVVRCNDNILGDIKRVNEKYTFVCEVQGRPYHLLPKKTLSELENSIFKILPLLLRNE